MRFSLPLRLLVPASLVLLVATLATLQYRWLGQVSEAERDRRQKSLSQHAAEFADDFDREILRLYLALQVDGGRIDRGDFTAFAKSYDTWRENARFTDILRGVYLANGAKPNAPPQKYDPDARTFRPVEWPASLAPVTERLARAGGPSMVTQTNTVSIPPPPPPPAPAPTSLIVTPTGRTNTASAAAIDQLRHLVAGRDPIVASVPALVVSLPALSDPSENPQTMSVRVGETYLVAELDGAYITNTFLPFLAQRYFPDRDADDSYRFAVVDTTDHNRSVYVRGLPPGAAIDPSHADASTPLFSLRFDLAPQVAARTWFLQSMLGSDPVAAARSESSGNASVVRDASVSIYVASRAGSNGDVFKLSPVASAWQLRLQHSAGSLDAAVGNVRRRNLWLSFGILTVLAASVVLVVVSAQRWQRLAAQQMDFVAAVTHELRTPLTVIRSAAQNLSAGVVHDGAQARQYGDLIETEGRRLTDMVEQVLEYAGLSGNRRLPERPIDVSGLIRDVVTSASAMPDASQIDITADVPDDLPTIVGDEGALRRALQNLIGNALKYGSDGRWIGVTARRVLARGNDEIQIAVSDRGRGIEPDDLAHIFEPFYRGRYAIERQIHGNGLGLSLVRRIAEAHGGRVTVTSTPGEGTTFTIALPAPIRLARTRRSWSQPGAGADAMPPAAESHPATE